MTLAQRLLAATAVLTIATTAVLGFAVREAWRRTEESRFLAEFHQAVADLHAEIEREVAELPKVLEPLCAHEPLVDSALIGRKSGDLPERRLSISLRIPEMMRANRFDELTLLTDRGEVLGRGQSEAFAGHGDRPGAVQRVRELEESALLREEEPRAWEASCRRGDGDTWVALIAARHVEPLLDAASRRHGLELSLTEPPAANRDAPQFLTTRVDLPELGSQPLWATRSRTPLTAALRQLDLTVAVLGASTILLALLVASWIARGLARPVVQFALQAREVVRGTAHPIAASGGRELEEAAAAFNQTLEDLASLKNRLAATERIAARREVARRVAHEIKNPLAPIRASIETLRRLHARQDPAFQEYFDEATRTVLAEVSRINHIVSEFTRYERLPAPRPTPFDVLEATRSLVQLHQSQGIPIHFEATSCPPLHADRDQFVQILTNLIQNAQDALGDEPEPRILVRVVHHPERNSVELTVEDNGPGVPEELRSRLFEPYATSKAHGTGLGLAIAQRIAVEHGGDLYYSAGDEPRKAATLPPAAEAETSLAAAYPSRPPAGEALPKRAGDHPAHPMSPPAARPTRRGPATPGKGARFVLQLPLGGPPRLEG